MSASTSPSACSSPGSCSTRPSRCSSARPIDGRRTSPRVSPSRSGTWRRDEAIGSGSSRSAGRSRTRSRRGRAASASSACSRRFAASRQRTGPARALSRLRSPARARSRVSGRSSWSSPTSAARATGASRCSQLAGHHDVIAVEIRDPREQELTNVGLLYLVDPETGRQLRVDTRSRRLRERFAVAAAAERGELARSLSSVGVRHVVLSTSGDWLRPLVDVPPAESRVTFTWPLVLIALAADPGPRRALHRSRSPARRVAGGVRQPRSPAERRGPRARDGFATSPPVIMLVALVFLIVGVARPHATVSVPREEATIVLAMDVSRSMKATDVEPTRLDAARIAAKTFLDEVPEKFRVGVVSFATRAAVGVAPTEDRELVVAALDTLAPGEGTAIGDAVALSLRVGQPQEQGAEAPPRAIVLLSDGARDGGQVDPCRGREAGEEARRARLLGARRHARRRRRGEADRRLQAHHPRAAEPRDARAGRRDVGRRVLRGARRRRAEPRLRGARLAARHARAGSGDHRRVRRYRRRARCSIAATISAVLFKRVP